MQSIQTRQRNEEIIDDCIRNILKDVFREAYTLGKIDKEILSIDDSNKMKQLFDRKIKHLKDVFSYESK